MNTNFFDLIFNNSLHTSEFNFIKKTFFDSILNNGLHN